jgi:hypothetical protein
MKLEFSRFESNVFSLTILNKTIADLFKKGLIYLMSNNVII